MNNKLMVVIFSLLLSAGQGIGQTLSQMRCYFDGNIAAAEYFSLGNIADIDAPFTVDVSALSNGIHRLYLEVMDNNGRWSLYDSDLIQVGGGLQMAQLNAVEYFFDSDPGFGEGIQIAVSGTDLDDDFTLSVDGLANGIHRLYMRVRDGANQWSLYASKLIQVNGSVYDELVSMEYFFDTDPGLGQANAVQVSGLTFEEDIELSLAGIIPGHHKLYIRVMDARGQWSLYACHNVEITGGPEFLNLVQAEYFFDTDPGMGNGSPILIPTGPDVDADFDVSVPSGLSQTSHIMYIRVKDSAGQWSLYATQNIDVCSIQVPSITQSGGGCVGSIVTLNAGAGYNSYSWNNNAISQSILVSQPGIYSVTVTDDDCTATAEIEVVFDELPAPVIIQNGIACNGNTVTLDAGGGFESYTWNTNAQSQTIQITESGLYSVTVSNGSCTGTDFIDVDFGQMQAPEITILGDPCTDDVLTLDAGPGYSIYAWSNSMSTQTIQISQTGTYGVTVVDGICSSSGQIFVEFGNISPPVISQSGSLCSGDALTLNAGIGYDSYEWNNLMQTQTITVTQDGVYSVVVTNGNCSASDEVTIDFIEITTPEIQTLGDPCVDAVITLDAGSGYDSYLWNNDVITQMIQINQSGTYSVLVSIGQCTAQDEVIVEFGQPVEPVIAVSGGFCFGETFTLDAGAGYSDYLWSNGMETQVIEVTEEGVYGVTVSNGSCSSSTTIDVHWANVLPVPLITQEGNTLISDIDPLIYMVQWFLNGEPISGATSPTLEAVESGVYTVSLHDGICTRFSADFNFVYNTTDEQGSMEILLFPNPANDILMVQTGAEIAVMWLLIDEVGRIIASDRNAGPMFTVNVSALASGTYTMMLTSDRSVWHERIVVAH